MEINNEWTDYEEKKQEEKKEEPVTLEVQDVIHDSGAEVKNGQKS